MYAFHIAITTPLFLALALTSLTHADWHPQNPEDVPTHVSPNIFSSPACSGAIGHHCNAKTTNANCQMALSEACSNVTGSGAPRADTRNSSVTYPAEGGPDACVVSVINWQWTTPMGVTAALEESYSFDDPTQSVVNAAIEAMASAGVVNLSGPEVDPKYDPKVELEYQICTEAVQSITNICFDPGNSASQKGAGGLINGIYDDGYDKFDPNRPSYYVRAAGCSPGQLGWASGT
ncbi:hypothetical protein MMC06_006118 [Schaereria dolodes]|nr:hypothetical protein [Schaereria dolodes]